MDINWHSPENQKRRVQHKMKTRRAALRRQAVAGGDIYIASAVHFDGSASLLCSSLACTDNGRFSQVIWVKALGPFAPNVPVIWVCDPSGSYNNFCQFSGDDPARFYIGLAGGPDILTVYAGEEGVNLADGAWHCIIYSADTNAAAASRKFKFYVDDVDVTDILTDQGISFAPLFNGVPFMVGDDGAGPFVGDAADWRLMPGVSLLDGSGNIPLATRRFFIDANGKPVDPAVATAALGVVGPVLFSGNDSAFATNQGTGGTFTLTGSLTNATTSPSD